MLEDEPVVTHISIDSGGGYTVGRRGRQESLESFSTYHRGWTRGYTLTAPPESCEYVLQFPYGNPAGHDHTLNRVARQMVIELGAGDPGELHGIVDFTAQRAPFDPMRRDEVYRLKRVYRSVCDRLGISTSIDPDADLWPMA
ncbi:hypothetical protein KIK06_29180 [Nocardiopsis sp. EMB25]|uniref:hypothetical protein n=1 Tax=Nocardiopsis sp. EMB25 TaxID=2835867 RepID=UPI00228494D9|nr:hypothetical protein [Nocardiopsis sp. EMB25]MCY9787958.1 hypothetical protein [Nocardiopsis sp. EMB25]